MSVHVEPMNMNPWDQIKQELESALTRESYNNWVRHTRFGRLDKDRLMVYVPDEATKTWLDSEYSSQIHAIIRALHLPVVTVEYLVDGDSSKQHDTHTNGIPRRQAGSSCPHLNPNYTFQTFVVGASNQMARAAAHNVATWPSRSYNPLFIHGDTGVGKTHLLHAIGHELVRLYPSIRLILTSTEQFINEMIDCIHQDRMRYFHERYRSVDVLLIDDIQLLRNNERT